MASPELERSLLELAAKTEDSTAAALARALAEPGDDALAVAWEQLIAEALDEA